MMFVWVSGVIEDGLVRLAKQKNKTITPSNTKSKVYITLNKVKKKTI